MRVEGRERATGGDPNEHYLWFCGCEGLEHERVLQEGFKTDLLEGVSSLDYFMMGYG